MNNKEKDRIDILVDKVDGLSIRMGNVEQSNEQIITNHLPHLNLKINITLGGLAFIAVMIAILGCMIAWG